MNRCLFTTRIIALGAVALTAGCFDDDEEIIDDIDRSPFVVTIENIGPDLPISQSGGFDTAVGAEEPGAIGPGERYQVQFEAGPEDRISFATMFVESNDLFFAPVGSGIRLYNGGGNPLTGDITGLILLWDAGTEVNEAPGLGENQAPRQSALDTGLMEGGMVRRVDGTDMAGFEYPPVEDVIAARLEHDGDSGFTLTIENVSDENTLETGAVPLSPGVFAIHNERFELFDERQPAPPYLEALAEDGQNALFIEELDQRTGETITLSSGAWAVHDVTIDLVQEGQPVSELLERLARSGAAGLLPEAWSNEPEIEATGVFETPSDSLFGREIGPGESTAFTVFAGVADVLTIAARYGQSQDVIVSFEGSGAPFFVEVDGDLTDDTDNLLPFAGDVTDRLTLYEIGPDGLLVPATDTTLPPPIQTMRVSLLPTSN